MNVTGRGTWVLTAALLVASTPAAHGSGDDPSPADDLLQITLRRLVAEAPAFASFSSCSDPIANPFPRCDDDTHAAITVIRLDTGEKAAVNGEAGHAPLSAAKALWVAIALGSVTPEVLAPDARAVFRRSSDTAATTIIDLIGPPPAAGIDAINAATAAWGLSDTWLAKWYGGRRAGAGGGAWGGNSHTTTDDLAGFWVMLGRGELLGGTDTARLLRWAALPRDDPGEDLIPNRLPGSVAVAVPHKSGWSDANRSRRVDGGLVTTPGGITYAIAVAFKAESGYSDYGGAPNWARYASCEVYRLMAEEEIVCTRSGDPASIRENTTAPIGSLTRAHAQRDRLRVSGWALDRDAGAAPIRVRVTVDGARVGTITADRLNLRVHERHGLGVRHGFAADLDVDLTPGSHRVCAVARNDSPAGPHHRLGCLRVTVPRDHPPVGNLGSVRYEEGWIVAGGWARDADTTEPIRVRVVIGGERLGAVQARRGISGDRFRLRAQAPPLPGDHQVCAVALNHGAAGPNRLIGCRPLSIPNGPASNRGGTVPGVT